MELRIYDASLNLKGIIENQRSVTWTRKYFEAGEFSIKLPITRSNVDLCKIGNLVTFRSTIEAGVIEDVQLEQSSIERVIIIGGRFLSSYMDRRLIRPTVNYNGLVEVAMRNLLTGVVPIPLVELGDLKGFTDTVEFQATYKNLLDFESKLSRSYNIGFRFRPDFSFKKIYFETFRGLDRTRHQSDRAFVEFSNKFDNINKSSYRDNSQLLKTVGYVGGEGEGSERTYVTVGDDTLTGLERREIFIDAKDISSDDITQQEYLASLAERGNEKMDECIRSTSMECETVPSGNYEYLKDYDLGDIVTVRNTDLGLSQDLRITEVTEIYEYGNATIRPILGSALPVKFSWED